MRNGVLCDYVVRSLQNMFSKISGYRRVISSLAISRKKLDWTHLFFSSNVEKLGQEWGRLFEDLHVAMDQILFRATNEAEVFETIVFAQKGQTATDILEEKIIVKNSRYKNAIEDFYLLFGFVNL